MKKLGQVVSQHNEGRLHPFGFVTHGPCFGFIKFVFDVIEALFDPPSHEVKLRDEAGRNRRAEVGQEGHFFAGFRDDVGDPPDHSPGAVADEFVGHDSRVEGVFTVVRLGQGMFQLHVFLHAGEKINAAVVFPAVPLLKVDAGPIPDVEDFLAFFRALSEGFDVEFFEHSHVIGLFVGSVAAESKVGEKSVPEVEGVKVSDGVFDPGLVAFVVRAGGVEMTVASIKMEVFQGLGQGGDLRKKIVRLERELAVGMGEISREAGEVPISTGAFARFKIVAFGNVGEVSQNSALHESTAGSVVAKDPLKTHADPLGIWDLMAEILVFGLGLKSFQRSGETGENRT